MLEQMITDEACMLKVKGRRPGCDGPPVRPLPRKTLQLFFAYEVMIPASAELKIETISGNIYLREKK
ncbi:MAG: hypothetical protein K9G67_11500 [Bacteroidales bacterium]|nr:hypothetical protein [Bacteroidales bacterium]MCF8344594.1 hypothetical protein [Bacteroidales bacterium]MCF8350679.1 hypothetical protein [Bacteroidales bacterium]MCF8376972.1 hypothetical protein [Bacteroidales bacterium]MCF8400875.1 hypothetical protein [Bacteroidales bacterium]